MAWLASRIASSPTGAESWKMLMAYLNTPPQQAFADPERRAETVRKYQQLKAAEQSM